MSYSHSGPVRIPRSAAKMLVNGQPAYSLPITDRGLCYGDGLFETMLAENRRIPHWPLHLARLQQGCNALDIPCLRESELEQDIQQLLAEDVSKQVLKLIITRGSGGRGYRAPDHPRPQRLLSLHPYPEYPDSYWRRGVALYPCKTRLGLNPALAGVKHLNRLEQVLARSEWTGPEYAEGLMLDIEGFPVEGTMTNLFWFRGDRLCTPELERCGVAGVARQRILKLAEEFGFAPEVRRFSLPDLLDADGVFVCNAVIGIWPVRQYQSTGWPVLPQCIQLQQVLAA